MSGHISGGTLATLVLGAGMTSANLHYQAPMLAVLARDFNAPAETVGMVPMATMIGYALGLLLLAPLGDRVEKKLLIISKLCLLVAIFTTAGFAVSLPMLIVASFLVGALSGVTQDVVTVGVQIAPAEARGRVLSQVMTGVFLGILFGRIASGLITQWVGWRGSFWFAAAIQLALVPVMALRLPRTGTSTNLGYFALMASLWGLYRRYGKLRYAVSMQGLMLLGYGAFWATISPMLYAKFGLGSAVAGLFAIPGAAGALVASRVGRGVDRNGPSRYVGLGLAGVLGGFLLLWMGQGVIAMLVLGTIVFDLGVRTAQVANQATSFSIDPNATSRLNSILFLHMFGAHALGAIVGSIAWARYGWDGVVTIGLVAGGIAFTVWWTWRNAWPAKSG